MWLTKQICTVFFILGFVLCSNENWGAELSSRDSLFQIWENTSLPDTIRMGAMAQMISSHYASKIPDSAFYYSQQLLERSEMVGNAYYKAYALGAKGKAVIIMGRFNEAHVYLEESFKLFKEIGDQEGLANAYNSLGLISQSIGENDKALEQFGKGIELMLRVEDSAAITPNLINIAAIYETQGNILKSLEYNKQTLDICIKYDLSRNRAIVHNNMANNYKSLGDVSKSAHHYFQSRTIYENEGNTWGVVSTLNNLALLYMTDNNYKNAEKDLEEALAKAIEIDFVEGQAMTYANIGTLQLKQKKYQAAIDAFKECLKIVEENEMTLRVPYVQLELGRVYTEMKQYDKAENYTDKGLVNSEEYGVASFIVLAYLQKGRLLIEQQRWEEAKLFGEKGYEKAKDMRDLSVQADFAVQLVKVYKNLGYSVKALAMYETNAALRDSFLNEETSRDLIRQEYQYDYEKKAYQDSLANVSAMQLQTADLKRRKVINRFLWGILLLVAIFIGVLINRFRLIRNQKLLIQEEKEKAETANAKLLEIDQSKSRFFTNISHEFRTPLTVIAGMAEQIKEGGRIKKLIQRNTNHLLQLINQILDLRKLESGSLPTRFIQADVVGYLRYIMESFHSLAEEKQISLTFKSSQKQLMADYDPEKLLRMVSNLLSNAIKFTPAGGEVILKVDVELEVQEPMYQFSVIDNGVGIPNEKLPYIFDRFYQVDDSTTRAGEGTGIGLALTKELVQLLNGTVKVKTKEGKGTSIIIELPYTQDALIEEESENQLSVIATRMSQQEQLTTSLSVEAFSKVSSMSDENLPSLLIVEDNPDVMEYLITCLEGDYQLSFAVDGLDGLEKALEQVPDIIISDVMMPRMDGFELCNTLKTDERTSHIPIVLLTAKADVDSRITGLQRGADAYLSKPFDKRELKAQLQNLLAIRKQLQSRYGRLEPLEPTEDIVLQQEDAFITKLREAFEAKMNDPTFDLTALSKTLLLSRSQLGRKVKALTGRTPAIYLRALRLQKAKTLLLTTDLSIKEVAYDVGFSNPAYFSNSYNEEFGEYPTVTKESQKV